MSEEEQRSCGFEDCQRPLEVKPGHRRKEYCNDKCRQAAHRLRVEREQAAKKVSLDYYLTKYHSPRLRSILERTLKEQGASDLLHLVVAIDEEISQVQGSDAMGERVTYLQMQLSEYRKVVDLDDREKIGQQFLAVGQLLGYCAIDKYHIGEGLRNWEEYRSWTYEATLAEVIVYARVLVDEEMAARERAKKKQEREQDTRGHPSGAMKIAEAAGSLPPILWFPDCQVCIKGLCKDEPRTGYGIHRFSFPCPCCARRYLEWHKEHKVVRYSISRSNYPIHTRMDTSKSLIKSGGRHFYQEVDYQARACLAARVQAFALSPSGKVSEQLWIDGKACLSFATLELAQAWIEEQMGTSLRSFWLS